MKIITEVTEFEALKDMVWAGAETTLNRVQEEGKEAELMSLLDEIFYEGATDTDVNDFLWFEDETIYESLGIETEEEE